MGGLKMEGPLYLPIIMAYWWLPRQVTFGLIHLWWLKGAMQFYFYFYHWALL